MEVVAASQGTEPWLAISGPSTYLDSRHYDAGRIDVFDLAHPERQRSVPSSERFDFLGGQVLWAGAASNHATRTLYATANDFENGQPVILAYAIEPP